ARPGGHAAPGPAFTGAPLECVVSRFLPCRPSMPHANTPELPTTMRALVKREAARGIWMEEVPVPSPGANEVLVKVEKTAICGTDLHIYLWDEWSQRTIKPGLVIGHEFVGRVAQIGPGVT